MQRSDEVRIGVLGLGAIAQVVHLPVLSGMAGVRIVAVCDADDQKAKSLAARFGVERVFLRDEEVFRADDLDAVVICTPNHLHEEQAIAALESGKHVLVEKPLAMTAEGAAKAVAVAERSAKALVVAMNNRYRPDTQALRPFVSGGELGEVFLTRGAWLNRKIRVLRPTWRHRLATAGGGALMDLGVQTLDLCLWILGYPVVESVYCHTHLGEGMEVEDSAAIVIGLAGGSAITVTVSWNLVAERDRQYMRFLATRGSAAIAPFAVYKEVEHGLLDVTPALQPGTENVYTASYRQELTHFVEACRGKGVEPPREQIELMEVIALAYRSAREKQKLDAPRR
jgi:predicted dehydrogenase